MISAQEVRGLHVKIGWVSTFLTLVVFLLLGTGLISMRLAAADEPDPPVDPQEGLVARWTFNDDCYGYDSMVGDPEIIDASPVEGVRAVRFDGNSALVLGESEELKPDAMTLSFWVRRNGSIAEGEYGTLIDATTGTGRYGQGWGLGKWGEVETLFILDDEDRIRWDYDPNLNELYTQYWMHLAFIFDAGNRVFRVYKDGEEIADFNDMFGFWRGSWDSASITSYNTPVSLGALPDGSDGVPLDFSDIRIYDRVLEGDEIAGLTASVDFFELELAKLTDLMRVGEEAEVIRRAAFNVFDRLDVAADDVEPELWSGLEDSEDTLEVRQATLDILSELDVTVGDPALTGALAMRGADELELEINPGETVTLGPVGLYDPSGEVAYQWYLDDEPIEGATGDSLTISDADPDDLGSYYVLIDDDRTLTPVKSRRKRLPDWPIWDTDLSAESAEPGDTVTLGPVELYASRGEVTYQWYFNDEPIEGATESTLTITDISADDLGLYHVVVDDDLDLTPVESSRRTPAEWPVWETNLYGDVAAPGDSVTLGPVELYDPRGEVTYQWYFNDEPIDGATESTLELVDVSEDDLGTYHVLVDDDLDARPVSSRNAQLSKDVGWPAYRKDAARSAVTAERLNFPLGNAWERRMSQLPDPAWPDAGRSFSVFDFDRAFMPVAANGIVYQASSADDTVYALDASDGAILWTYTTGAPVRLAPHIAHGRCYFSSDDGMVYSLDAETGEEIWTFHAAFTDRMLIGNDRLISRRPSRSGVLVEDDTVYVTAGMWPTEGVAVYALDAETGDVKWLNDTMNALYLPYPHDGVSLGGPTSQGYLLSDGEALAMPTGESSPAILDAGTGELIHWDARGAGSTWAMLIDGFVATAARGWQPNLPPRLGEMEILRSDGLDFYSMRGGRGNYGKWDGYDGLPGGPRAGAGRLRGQISPIGGRSRAVYSGDRLYTYGMGELGAVDSSGDSLELLWRVDHELVYSMALTSGALIAGSDGFVSALDVQTGEEIWRGGVDGRVHGLAVAGGTLYASTDRGVLYAFAPGHELQPAERHTARRPEPIEGFALVAGGNDTAEAEALADGRNLQVVALLPDEQSVRQARERLVHGEEYYYGHDIIVHKAPQDGTLPYADYFASEVLVVGGGGNVRPSELYRVLRPLEGRLSFTDMDQQPIEEFVSDAGIPDEEYEDGLVSRGRLDDVFDWNSEGVVDEHVSWPLELHWFGTPGRMRTMSRHRGGPSPVPAGARVFAPRDGFLAALDAYSGRELWGYYAPGYRHIAGDDDYAYVGIGGRVIQLDAHSGAVERIYGDAPDPQVYSLEERQEFSSESDDQNYSGTIAVSNSGSAIEVELEASSPTPADRDGWVMWFDFRPPEQRLRPIGTGRFPIIVDTKRGALRRFEGFNAKSIPVVDLSRSENGYLLSIPFDAIEQLTGSVPDSFDMSAEIQLHAQDSYQGRRLNGAPLSNRRDLWRAGNATFVLSGEAQSSHSPLTMVDRADSGDIPSHASDWGRWPLHQYHDGNRPRLPVVPEGREELAVRENPITGEEGDLFYLRGYGCSGTVASATMNMFRSGTVGLYDLEDDSGMRNLPGTRAGCRLTLSPALGVLTSVEGTGDCFCAYNFPTSLGMIPARSRSNEDWAVFKDQARADNVRRLGLNLGAPGERRDEGGLLWFGYPKDRTKYVTGGSFGPFPHGITLPVELDVTSGGGPYRVNADRVEIANTNRPWIKASGIEGVRSLAVSLVYYDHLTTAVARSVDVAPAIDGDLDEEAWTGPAMPIDADNPGGIEHADEGRVRVRYDSENMYLAFTKRALVDRRGTPQPFDSDTRFNVLFKNASHPAYAQFSVDMEGETKSASVSSALELPHLADFTPDSDWGEQQGARVVLGEEHGSMRLAWTDQGLAVMMEVPKEPAEGFAQGLRAQFANIEEDLITELVVDREGGTAEILRCEAPESEASVFDEMRHAPLRPRHRDTDMLRESESVDADVAFSEEDGLILVQTVIPLQSLELDEVDIPAVGFQFSAFDPGHEDPDITQGAEARNSLLGSNGHLSLIAGNADTSAPEVTTANIRNNWYGRVWSFDADQREIPADRWESAVSAEDGVFNVEIAIPLSVLAEANLSMDNLLAQLGAREDISTDLEDLYNLFRSRFVRVQADEAPEEPETYTLRLHFAELNEDVEPGDRVFDIKIQGHTALEGFDIIDEAGGHRRAITREFEVASAQDIEIELVPHAGEPWISGVELLSTMR